MHDANNLINLVFVLASMCYLAAGVNFLYALYYANSINKRLSSTFVGFIFLGLGLVGTFLMEMGLKT